MEKYIVKEKYGKVAVVQNKAYQWGVIDSEGHFIVPFGKYGWIDGFDSGLARVRTHLFPNGKKSILSLCKWGIINENGEEVLPLDYDNIWIFFEKHRYSTTVEKDGQSFLVTFEIK